MTTSKTRKTNLKQKTKNGRRPQKKMEEDLKKSNGRQTNQPKSTLLAVTPL